MSTKVLNEAVALKMSQIAELFLSQHSTINLKTNLFRKKCKLTLQKCIWQNLVFAYVHICVYYAFSSMNRGTTDVRDAKFDWHNVHYTMSIYTIRHGCPSASIASNDA
uniref:Transmembrane protein n=1 Tax=Ascaris lumbricoides TaxID=6252 RepID=A0A0M3IPD6_ASCLU